MVPAALRAACRAAVGLAFLALTARLRRSALWGMAGFLALLALIARLRRAALWAGCGSFSFLWGWLIGIFAKGATGGSGLLRGWGFGRRGG